MTATLAAALAALALGTTPGGASAPAGVAPAAPPRVLLQEEDDPPPYAEDEGEGEGGRRLFVSAWGGEALDAGGAGRSHALAGGEVAWALGGLDLGLAGFGYRNVRDATREWTPVALFRIGQRFPMRGGTEALLVLGVGAARPDGWIAWYQLALGVRVPLGPLFLGGEVGFEQYDLIRLAAGLGVAF